MNETMIMNIPRIYTALAEWCGCLIYIVLMKRKIEGAKLIGICAVALVLQGLALHMTGSVPEIFWIPCMLMAVGLMFLLLYLCCDLPLLSIAYCCIRAFLLAEFAASLEWQLYTFFLTMYGWKGILFQWVFLISVFTAVFFIYGILEKKIMYDNTFTISQRELWAAVIIVLAAFTLSNLSYVYTNTPFSGKFVADIFNIRTLVDLGGVAILDAFQSRITEVNLKTELVSINSVLKSQYNQYLQYKESIDTINCKYHDMKHMIAAIRSEGNIEKRTQWLDAMEQDFRIVEAENNTGNSILDTILTGKQIFCQKHEIKLTYTAEGELLNSIHVTDICTIFGNALDNAIESVIVQQDITKRLIYLSVTGYKNFIFIRVENYCDNDLVLENDMPMTTKSDKKNHGYGLKSIRFAVQKYKGDLSFGVKDNWFELKILIPRS